MIGLGYAKWYYRAPVSGAAPSEVTSERFATSMRHHLRWGMAWGLIFLLLGMR